MKYFSPSRYWRKFVWLLNKSVLPLLERIFAPSYATPLKHLPIFVIGAPRSGSTLMIQVIADAFDLGYLSNRHCQLFGAPSLAEYLFRPLRNRPPSSYRSEHGRTEGWHEASECGEWWYRFFRRHPAYVTREEVDGRAMRLFRRSLLALTDALGKPIIFKNLYASFRIQAINEHVPEALFVVTRRREVDNAVSLLEARKRVSGSYEHWWSMPPPNVNELRKMAAWQQVVEQIREIHRLIERDFAVCAIAPNRIHIIEYEAFCEDVHAQLGNLSAFLAFHGYDVPASFEHVPKSFPIRTESWIDRDLYNSLVNYVAVTR